MFPTFAKKKKQQPFAGNLTEKTRMLRRKTKKWKERNGEKERKKEKKKERKKTTVLPRKT